MTKSKFMKEHPSLVGEHIHLIFDESGGITIDLKEIMETQLDKKVVGKAIDKIRCLKQHTSWAMGCIDGSECRNCETKRKLKKELGLE